MRISRSKPCEYNGKIVHGTIKRNHIKFKPQPVFEPVEKEFDIKIPDGYTFDEMGDYHKSNNSYKDQIKTIKQPKKRKAKMNHKIEGIVESNAHMASMYINSNMTIQGRSKQTANKRKKNR